MSAELVSLKSLLWERWDPIGVNDDDWAKDEYDTYASSVLSMLNAGADEQEIADYLSRVQTETMGMAWTDIHTLTAAAAIKIHEEAKR